MALCAHVSGQQFPEPDARVGDISLYVTAVAPEIFRVTFCKDPAFLAHPSFSVLDTSQKPIAEVVGGSGNGNIISKMGIDPRGDKTRTGQCAAHISKTTGQVQFFDSENQLIVEELSDARLIEPAQVQGSETCHVAQRWSRDKDEALFGLGQHQLGLVNIAGYDLDLWQHNTEIAIPFLVSSKGYGILWDNPSYTKFGGTREFTDIPPDALIDAAGKRGGLTATSFSDLHFGAQSAQRVDATINAHGGGGATRARGNQEQSVRWEGQVVAAIAGDYQFRLYADGAYKLWIDRQLVFDHWRQGWLAGDELAKVHFDAGSTHTLKLEWSKEQGSTCRLTWKTPDAKTAGTTGLWSQVGGGIDYYFIYGGKGPGAIDRVIAGYRKLTGQAPMMPVWAFGLWQSRQRYETQQASLDVVKGFRERMIPFDNIVQDWMYWRQDDWGSHKFDEQRFPNPDQWIKDIHSLNARVMISVWPKFYPTTDNYKALADKGFMLPVYPARDWVARGFQYAFYDPYSAEARDMFWQSIRERLFSKGVDAWWMDATEPEFVQPSPTTLDKQLAGMATTTAGTGASVLNAYPLLNSQAIYEGQRKAAPDQRVFILTRSGYAGQQRYAAASWSGDITSTWSAMKKQIAAGLGYSISGLPYWTMDCGGFAVPARFNSRNPTAEALDEWRELNARWFQFATFIPLLRVHGEFPFREMWQFGGEDNDAYKTMLKFDRLRYRLLPYIYSVAADVTHNAGTFMRPLVMDFPNDTAACNVTDQFMFGPAFLVNPVCEYRQHARTVVLPAAPGGWYDFWTGNPPQAGGQTILAAAPYDAIPIFIRAGSIIPFGPDLQYTTEKKSDPLTLFIYTGADGKFTLYEDDGLTYQYEKGASSRISLIWNEQTKTLHIAKREGTFPGILAERTFNLIFVRENSAVGFTFDPPIQKTVKYSGESLEFRL